MSVEDIPFIDVAIVGGGVSGAYTAYRLLSAPSTQSKQLRDWAEARGGKLSVSLFEMSDRIGGRLLSARPPGAPNIVCELGGMRYMSTQTLVKSLVENELRLRTTPQIVDEPQNLVYLRGRHLRQRDLIDSALLPYNLPWNERGRQPADLLGFALTQIIPGVATAKPSELRALLNAFELDGKPLYQHGFWNVVARALSREGYALSTATVGYDSLGANGNAVDQTFEYFDFTPGTQYNLLTDGYEEVPWELSERARNLGCRVEFKANLASFDKIELPDRSQGVRLVFRDGRKIDARAIVLAMPQRSLRLLEPKGPVLDPEYDAESRKVQSLIDSVFPVALFKMFLAYPFPWWEAQGVTEGRSLTDLMVRQCYYWGVEHGAGADHNHQHALLMAYDDQSNVQFWGGLRNLPLDHPGDHAPPTPLFQTKQDAFTRCTEKDDEDENWRLNKAPEIMVEEMHRQIMELHGVTYAPAPYAAAYHDWSDDPFGGGVHFWKIGYRSTETMNLMAQPRPDFPCYVCGEAYSQGQTWVEGALQTAEIVLQSHFGLQPPPWLEESS